MWLHRYLPSTQFAVMVGALVLSGGLVALANFANGKNLSPSLAITGAQQNNDWENALKQVAQSSGVPTPQAPDQTKVQQLLSAAQSPNLTNSLGRSLLVNLAAAKAQGLGDDTPTEQQIVNQAITQSAPSPNATYTSNDLMVESDSKDNLRTYGNAVMKVLASHEAASAGSVLLAVGYATDYQDSSRLGPLQAACPAYLAAGKDLLAVSVPQSISSLHLEVVNDVFGMGYACQNLLHVISDPLRGLEGLQQFEALDDEATRVFTSIAKNLNSDGILFSKDEPGSAWSAFLAASAQ